MKLLLNRVDEVANQVINNKFLTYLIFLLPVFVFGFHQIIYAQTNSSNYDFISYVSNNQIISGVLLTVIIGVITALTKFILVMKRQLDTIDVVAQAEIKLREDLVNTQKEYKEEMEKQAKLYREEIKSLRAEISKLHEKIDATKSEFHKILMDYLLDRGRYHGISGDGKE